MRKKRKSSMKNFERWRILEVGIHQRTIPWWEILQVITMKLILDSIQSSNQMTWGNLKNRTRKKVNKKLDFLAKRKRERRRRKIQLCIESLTIERKWWQTLMGEKQNLCQLNLIDPSLRLNQSKHWQRSTED